MGPLAPQAFSLLLWLIVLVNGNSKENKGEAQWDSKHKFHLQPKRLLDLAQSNADTYVEEKKIRIGENCSLPTTECKYFRPMKFITQQKNFIKEGVKLWGFDSLDEMCDTYKPVIDMITFDCGNNSTESDFCRPTKTEEGRNCSPNGRTETNPLCFLPRQFTFKHIRKTGGTTILSDTINAIEEDGPPFDIFPMMAWKLQNHGRREATERMDQIKRDQEHGTTHPLFLLVRNPVERFVSSASQAIKMNERYKRCTRHNSNTQVLSCVLHRSTRQRDIHLFPMLADMYCNQMGRDVEVSMYDMASLGGVLEALGVSASAKSNASPHSYSTKDLSESMVKEICGMYAWDVAMMELAGFPVPECEVS